MFRKKFTNKKTVFIAIFLVMITIITIYYLKNEYNSTNFKSNYSKIRVVVDDNYPPYIFKDNSGKIQGILVDQWKLWQSKTGIQVELDAMNWDKALSLMNQGKYDVIDTIFINDERKQIFDFTNPYVDIEVPIFFNKNITGIVDAESLIGFKVGVKKGDACIAFLKQKGITDLREYESFEELIKDAKDAKIKVFVMDKSPAFYFLNKYDIFNEFNYSDPLYTGQFHRAVMKGNSEMLSTVEKGFLLISNNEYKAINIKWLGSTNYYSNYISYAFGIICFIALVLFGANRFLKKSVKEKIAERDSSEKKYTELLMNLNVGVAIYSKTRKLVLCNNAYRDFFNFSKDEFQGNFMKKINNYLINPDGSTVEYDNLYVNVAFETKKPVHDFTLGIKMNENSNIVWVKGDCIPEFDIDKEVESVIITLVNITERVQTLELLKQNENRTKAIIKAIPDLFFIMNSEGVFIDYLSNVNDENLYVNKEYFINKSVSDIFGEDVASLFDTAIEKVKNTGKLELIEYPLYMNGKFNYYEARITMFDENSILTVVRDITKRKNDEKRIFEMSMHDSLTGLFNRNYFEEKLMSLKNEKTQNVGIIVCDIDGLKLVNDTLGHAQGDELIKNAASILKICCKEEDTIARIGGDEFVVIISNTSEEELETYANKIANKTEQLNVLEPIIMVSISVGYAISSDNNELQMVFREADSHMYREKLHHHQSKRSKNIELLSKMLEARDFITEGHGERLQTLTTELSKVIRLSEPEINDISLFAQFHDLGKIGIPDSILFKPGRLDDTEIVNMKRHTEIGYRIAKASPDLAHISDWILKHHERWDGKGYPYGLKGEEIPIQCRILAIVDAYDAMINDRPYRKAMSKEMAIEEIIKCAGTQFDPVLAEKFIKLLIL